MFIGWCIEQSFTYDALYFIDAIKLEFPLIIAVNCFERRTKLRKILFFTRETLVYPENTARIKLAYHPKKKT